MKIKKILVIFVTVAVMSIYFGCDTGPKRFEDPEILAKMKPIEDAFFSTADLVNSIYEHYKPLQNTITLPFGFNRLDLGELEDRVDSIKSDLEGLEYSDKEPYASSIKALTAVLDNAPKAWKKYWDVEETLASGRVPPFSMKSDVLSGIGACARGLQQAAIAIHIPKKEWPKWITEWNIE